MFRVLGSTRDLEVGEDEPFVTMANRAQMY